MKLRLMISWPGNRVIFSDYSDGTNVITREFKGERGKQKIQEEMCCGMKAESDAILLVLKSRGLRNLEARKSKETDSSQGTPRKECSPANTLIEASETHIRLITLEL